VGAGGVDDGPEAEDVGVGDVAVREDDLLHLPIADDGLEVRLGEDRDALGIEPAGERRGVLAAVDVRDLRGRESHDVVGGVVAVDDVEVVEVAPCGAHDDGADGAHDTSRNRG